MLCEWNLLDMETVWKPAKSIFDLGDRVINLTYSLV